MQRHRGLALIVLLAVAGLAACGTSGPRSPGGPAQDYAGLIATLRAAGATVVESDMVAQPPLAVPSKVLQVNSELVRTYEYANSAAAADAASGISADGATTCYSRTWMG